MTMAHQKKIKGIKSGKLRRKREREKGNNLRLFSFARDFLNNQKHDDTYSQTYNQSSEIYSEVKTSRLASHL